MPRQRPRRNAAEECGGESPLPPLPYDLASDVLSRLAAKTLLSLRCVCKSWGSLIDDDDLFISHHLARSKSNPVFVFNVRGGHFLSFREFGNPLVKRLNIPRQIKNSSYRQLLSSYDGLLFLGEPLLYNLETPVIVNPVTWNTVELPPLNCRQLLVSQLFFNPKSKEYSVLIISRPPTRDMGQSNRVCTTLVSRIFTAGKPDWRETAHHGEFGDFQMGCREAPLVRGSIHWINRRTSLGSILLAKIVAFDVEKETFRTFPSPPSCNFCKNVDNCIFHQFLLQYRGSLCLIHKVSTAWDMWVMGDDEIWVKERSLFTDLRFTGVSGNAFMNRNGEILLLIPSRHTPTVVSYHPELGTLQVFRPPIGDGPLSCFYVESLVRFNRKGKGSSFAFFKW